MAPSSRGTVGIHPDRPRPPLGIEPDPAGDLTVAPTQPRRGLLLVRVIGEVDVFTARRLGDVLVGAVATVADDRDAGAAGIPPDETPSVVCDLEGVTFLGASGLDAFVAVQETAQHRDVRLVVVASHRTVRRPFALTALDRVITLTDTHPAAGRGRVVPRVER